MQWTTGGEQRSVGVADRPRRGSSGLEWETGRSGPFLGSKELTEFVSDCKCGVSFKNLVGLYAQ
jgi:hypothetical protein